MGAALRYSFCGLRTALAGETSFRQETAVLFLLPVAGYFYGLPLAGLLTAMAGWLLVMALELMNMAVEAVCNLVSPGFNPLVKVAKDAGSAAVFLALLVNFGYWLYLACVFG
jgi:diacylglycerol kinase (ATP)